MTGPDEMSYNEPGKPPLVEIVEKEGAPFGGMLTLPPLSVLLYEIPAR